MVASRVEDHGGPRGAGPREGRVWLARALLAAGVVVVPVIRVLTHASIHPVSGRVLVGGRPAGGVVVVFHPVGPFRIGGNRPSAVTASDGSFALRTQTEGDGAPAGDYDVTLDWRESIRAGGEATPGRSLVPEAYTRRATTPLRVTVEPGTNRLEPFRIDRRPGGFAASRRRRRGHDRGE